MGRLWMMAIKTDREPLRPAEPSRVNNLRGALFMLAGMFVFAAVDAMAKYSTDYLPSLQIVWARYLGLFLGVVFLISFRGFIIMKSRHRPLQLVRGMAAAMSATLFIIGLHYVALADAVAVTFIAPLVVTILGALVLGERVGPHRWTATVIGFLGALMVIRPGFASFHPGLIFPFIAAILFAVRQIISRHISHHDRTATTVAYTSLTATFLLTCAMPFVWTAIEPAHLFLVLAAMSLLSALGEILVIRALEVGLAVFVSPLHYTIIIWASLYGFLLFGQFPDFWTWTGAAIITASGLYVMHRERVRRDLDD